MRAGSEVPKWWLVSDKELTRYFRRIEAQEISAGEAIAQMNETAIVDRIAPVRGGKPAFIEGQDTLWPE